ncbi:MAG TPA: hypothetical protein VF208_08040, partial [Candidatus Binatia bacterium]
TAMLWVFPYLEAFKSPRPFALEINRFVPVTAPLYIYADTMHDFNYYAGREKIPVVNSLPVLRNLLAAPQPGFLLVKERDLSRLAMVPRSWVIASDRKGRIPWHLVRFHSAPGSAITNKE